MAKIDIATVRLDSNGMAVVSPEKSDQWKSFSYIWRDASFVRWNDDASEFYIDSSGRFDALTSYIRICNAAKNECGVKLQLTNNTKFIDLTDDIRDLILNSQVDA